MIAYIVATCAKGTVYRLPSLVVKAGLLQEHARALDLLAAQRAQKVRDEPVHELEIRRESRRVLLRVVQNFLAVALRVHRGASPAVDEDELRTQDEALPLHVGAHRHHAATAEAVVLLDVALDVAGPRVRGEEHGAGHDERILEFLSDAFPVRGVGEDALVGLEI